MKFKSYLIEGLNFNQDFESARQLMAHTRLEIFNKLAKEISKIKYVENVNVNKNGELNSFDNAGITFSYHGLNVSVISDQNLKYLSIIGINKSGQTIFTIKARSVSELEENLDAAITHLWKKNRKELLDV